MINIPPLDIFALFWVFICWIGYTLFADREGVKNRNLMTAMREFRQTWMERMLSRENRMVDVNLMGTLMRSVSLFASTTIFILAGLLAILGSVDEARAILMTLPFTVETTRAMWEIKVLLLLVIFVYAFFKFAWSLRQFNYAIVFIGAAPEAGYESATEKDGFGALASRITTLAVQSFNRGMRAYYFGLAALSWFIHPILFIASSLWVVLVLYRREYHSRTLKSLSNPGEDL
ncbi:MAG: DUF599 domain-containing protein [Rhodospirillales bacterium]|nr:DUF599 domain-containing protein [Rhodospirillales bacterium]